MRFPKNPLFLLLVMLAVLAAVAINGCSSGGGSGSLFGERGTTQGTFVGGASGTTAGGQTYNVTIDHTANTFSVQNVTASKSYSGTISTPPSGFLETVTTASNDPSIGTLPVTGHSIEIPGTVVALHLTDDPTVDVVPLVDTGGVCVLTGGPTNFNSIKIPNTFDSTTSSAYSLFTITSTGTSSSSTITGNETDFRLDGTQVKTGAVNATCTNGVGTGSGSGNNDTFGFSADLFGIDVPAPNSNGSGFVAMPDPAVSIATIVAGQYTAMLFRHSHNIKLAGFGPGAGSSISGGAFANIKTDAFNTHANNITINFAAGPSAGLLTGSVVDENGVTHSPMIAEVNTFKGKIVILLLTADTTTTETFHILLKQQ